MTAVEAWVPRINPADLLVPPDQVELVSALRDVLVTHASSERTRAAIAGTGQAAPYDADLWRRLGIDLGLTGLMAPEGVGGLGLGVTEAALCLVETGRATACAPVLSSAVLAVTAALADPWSDRSDSLLARLVAGAVGTVALDTVAAPLALDAVNGELAVVTGRVDHVLDAAAAEVVVVLAQGDAGAVLVAVDRTAPGAAGPVAMEPHQVLDLTRGQGRVTLTSAEGRVLATGDEALRLAGRLERLATLGLAAEQLGVAERSFEATCDYVCTREQFGRPIGSFQAVKHRLAEVLLAVESARSAVRAAAVQIDAGDEQAPLSVAVAALVATEASLLATEEAVQLHGGIGFTWEHDAHLWFRRALSCEALQGGLGRRKAEVVAALGWAS